MARGFQISSWPLAKGRTCIPTSLHCACIRLFHEHLLHLGAKRLWSVLDRNCEFAYSERAFAFTQVVSTQCEVCQACQRPSARDGPIAFTPIPPRIMESVAIEVFMVEKVTHNNKKYDSMVICVDRHSGWLIAIPALNKGLTGEWIAKKIGGDLLVFHQ